MKYLFIAEYKDGATYAQNLQDISLTDEKRSCFFDVRQEDVLRFFLTGGDNVFCVDLSDGHFEVNEVPFFMHDAGLGLKDFRLIFYRQHTHQFSGDRKELAHDINFCIGWQTNDDNGKNVKRIMEIN